MPTTAATSALTIVAYFQIDSSLLASATVFLLLGPLVHAISIPRSGGSARSGDRASELERPARLNPTGNNVRRSLAAIC